MWIYVVMCLRYQLLSLANSFFYIYAITENKLKCEYFLGSTIHAGFFFALGTIFKLVRMIL